MELHTHTFTRINAPDRPTNLSTQGISTLNNPHQYLKILLRWLVRRLLHVTSRRGANSLLWVGRWLLELLGVSCGLLLELLLRGVFGAGGAVGSAILRLLDVLLDGLVGGGSWLAGDGAELVLLGYVGCGPGATTVADG